MKLFMQQSLLDKENDFAIPVQYQNTTPSLLPVAVQGKVVDMAKRAVCLTGINWCGFHVDMMVVDDQPKILEIGGRLGGSCINSHLIPLANPALNPYECMMQVIQGQNPFTKDEYYQDASLRSGVRALLPPQPGYITGVDGIDTLKAHPAVQEFTQSLQISDRAYLPAEKFDKYVVAYVVAQCDQTQSIGAILDNIASLLHVEVAAFVA